MIHVGTPTETGSRIKRENCIFKSQLRINVAKIRVMQSVENVIHQKTGHFILKRQPEEGE